MTDIRYCQVNTEEIKEWDIWLAEVLFEDKPDESKIRPVLILGNEDAICIDVAKITSKNKKKRIFDILIEDYCECGLDKLSTLKLDKKIKLNKGKLHKRIGRLTRKNIIQAKIILNRRK